MLTVEALALTVTPGEIVALAGRTAVARVIAGLERPRGGSIRLDGEEIAGAAPDRIAALGLSYVPANRRVFAELTVDENLTLGAYRNRRETALVAERRARAYALFPWLDGHQDQLAGTLSGGEQQMLVVARGLMSDPRVLILEEPSAGLGPPAVEALCAGLERVRDAGTAVLIVDEGLQVANRVADRVIRV